jgi:hypothetical protein
MDVEKENLREYLGSDMDFNTLSLPKLEDGDLRSAK